METSMSKIYDIIIIGSGPAGLTAAIYASRARLDALVIEKDPMSGGQVLNTYEVDNYPGLPGMNGFDLGQKLRSHADALQAVFKKDEIRKIERTVVSEADELQAAELEADGRCGRRKGSDGGKEIFRLSGKKTEYLTRTVIIASGASHRKLGVPGEETFTGVGVSYCATCDGAFYRNKTVAVVGGGDVAVEDAIYLARMCKKVYLIHRRDELRAAGSLQEQLFALENVIPVWNTEIQEIKGKLGVESVQLINTHTQELSELPVDGVFIAVGITPNSKNFDGLLEMKDGYIAADESGETSMPGIFAAGDVRTKLLRQIITAAADGANAVASAERFILMG